MKKLNWLLSLICISCTGSIQTPPIYKPCGRVFTPDAELQAKTEIATERWSKSTGCPVTVGSEGTIITYTDRLYFRENDDQIYFGPNVDEGRLPACGVYLREYDLIFIARNAVDLCPVSDIDGVIVHEIGHVLANRGGHAPDGALSIPSGLESERLITESTLLWVCLYHDCQEFIPELNWSLVQSSHPGLE